MSDAVADLVITGCTALVHGELEAIEFLAHATIVVRDGVIESVTAGPADGRGGEPAPALSELATAAPAEGAVSASPA